MNRKNVALFFLVSLMLLLTLPAAAFEHKNSCNGHWTRWQNSSRTLNVSTHVSQFWTSAWQYSVGAASHGWNLNAPGNNFRIYHNGLSPIGPASPATALTTSRSSRATTGPTTAMRP